MHFTYSLHLVLTIVPCWSVDPFFFFSFFGLVIQTLTSELFQVTEFILSLLTLIWKVLGFNFPVLQNTCFHTFS